MPSCGYSTLLAVTRQPLFPTSSARTEEREIEEQHYSLQGAFLHTVQPRSLTSFCLFQQLAVSPRVLLIKIWFCWCFQDCHPLCYEAENYHSGGWVQLTPASMEVEGIKAGDLLFLFLCSGHR